MHRHVFEQPRNYSKALLTLKKKVFAFQKNFIISEKHMPLPKNAGSTVPNDTKNTLFWWPVHDP